MGIAHTKGTAYYAYLIRFVTRSTWNHSLVYFDNVPHDLEPDIPKGTRVYFESIWKPDKRKGGTGKTGIRGPIPWFDLVDWLGEDQRHDLLCQTLPYGDDIVRQAYQMARSMVGRVGYAHLQIAANLKAAAGLSTPIWLRSPKKMTCSEFAAYLWDQADPGTPFHPGPARRHLEIGTRRLFDDIPPAGKHGLCPAVNRFLFPTDTD